MPEKTKPKQILSSTSLEPFRLKALERFKTQQTQQYLICLRKPKQTKPSKKPHKTLKQSNKKPPRIPTWTMNYQRQQTPWRSKPNPVTINKTEFYHTNQKSVMGSTKSSCSSNTHLIMVNLNICCLFGETLNYWATYLSKSERLLKS